MLSAPLLLLSVLAADPPLSEIYSRAQQQVDHLKCPCTEAGVTFSNADLPICGPSLVTVKMFKMMPPDRTANVTPTPAEAARMFVACVQRVQAARAAANAVPDAALTPDEQKACRLNVNALESVESSPDSAGHPARIMAAKSLLDSCVDAYRHRKESQRLSERPRTERETARFIKESEEKDDGPERARQMAIADEEKRIRLLVIDGHLDGNIMQVVDSANLCDAKGKRAETLAKIATEKRYAKKAGVINLSDLEDLKQELLEEDERIATVTADLRRFPKNALRCNDTRLSALHNCHDLAAAQSTLPDECTEDSMRVKLAIFRED